jgi:hypothetical protein
MNNIHLGKRIILIIVLFIIVVIMNISLQVLFPLQEIIINNKDIYDIIIWIAISGAYIIGTLLPINCKHKIVFAILLPLLSGIAGVLLSRLFIIVFIPCGLNCFNLDFRAYCSNASMTDRILHRLCTYPEWINYSIIIIISELLINNRKIIIGGIIGGIIGLIVGYSIKIIGMQISEPYSYIIVIITTIFPIIGILLGEKVVMTNITRNNSTKT